MANRTYSLEEVETEASEFLKTKQKINETTFLNYRTSINYFIHYLKEEGIEVLGMENKDKVLEDFQATLIEGFTFINEDVKKTVKAKPSTINSHVRRIKTFLNKRLGLTIELKKLEEDKPKYKALSKEEVELLAKECSNKWSNKEVAVRNETLIRFLFNTAFRIYEALSLEVANVYEEGAEYFVKIQEKGKPKGTPLKEIAISENTYKMLMDYINIKTVPSDYVFSSIKASEDGKAKAFNRQNFNKAIKELAYYVDNKYKGTKINDKPINISKTVANNSSHVFRHSKAVYLLNVVKEDIITVKEVLRHNSLDSTLIYLNPQEEAINKVRTSNDI